MEMSFDDPLAEYRVFPSRERAIPQGRPPTSTEDNTYFGDGIDGVVAISAGTTTLARDMYYATLTMSGTGKLNTNGFRVFVSGTLDISAAPAAAIYSGSNGGSRNGAASSGVIGGAAGDNSAPSTATPRSSRRRGRSG